MFRIDSDANVGGLFSSGDPTLGLPGTVVSADWLNAVQEEIAGLIEACGITLSKANSGQLLAAAVAAATANHLVRRDGSGRAQFADPAASQDAATKGYVDPRSAKAYGYLSVNAAGAVSVVSGFNIASASWSGAVLTVNFTDAMPGSLYPVLTTQGIANVFVIPTNLVASHCGLTKIPIAGGAPQNWVVNDLVHFVVFAA